MFLFDFLYSHFSSMGVIMRFKVRLNRCDASLPNNSMHQSSHLRKHLHKSIIDSRRLLELRLFCSSVCFSLFRCNILLSIWNNDGNIEALYARLYFLSSLVYSAFASIFLDEKRKKSSLILYTSILSYYNQIIKGERGRKNKSLRFWLKMSDPWLKSTKKHSYFCAFVYEQHFNFLPTISCSFCLFTSIYNVSNKKFYR